MGDVFVLAGVPFKTYTFLSSNGTAAKVDFLLMFLFLKTLKLGVASGTVLLGMTGLKLPSFCRY